MDDPAAWVTIMDDPHHPHMAVTPAATLMDDPHHPHVAATPAATLMDDPHHPHVAAMPAATPTTLTAAAAAAIKQPLPFEPLKKGEKIQLRLRNLLSNHKVDDDISSWEENTGSWKNMGETVDLCWDALNLRLKFVMLVRKMLEPATRKLKRAPTIDGDPASCWELVESLCKRTMQTAGGCCMYIALLDDTSNMVTVRFGESMSFCGFSENSSFAAVLQFIFPNRRIVFDSIAPPAMINQAKSRARKNLWSASNFTAVCFMFLCGFVCTVLDSVFVVSLLYPCSPLS